MTFNKQQKIASVIYLVLLISIVLFLTPYSYSYYSESIRGFGNLFTMEKGIVYTKLFIEIGILTVTYYLSLIILKTKS